MGAEKGGQIESRQKLGLFAKPFIMCYCIFGSENSLRLGIPTYIY